MRRESQIMRLTRKIGSLLSTFLVILTLVLLPLSVAEANDAPHQTIVIAVVVQSQAPANCHSYPSCTVYVVPSNVAVMAADALHRQRFQPPQSTDLAAFNPVFDTPPPHV